MASSTSSRSLLRRILPLSLLFAMATVGSTSGWAAPNGFRQLMDSPVARHLLLNTSEGRALVGKFLDSAGTARIDSSAYRAFVQTMDDPAMKAVRHQIEGRVRDAQSAVAEFHLRSGSKPGWGLSAKEKLLIGHFASRRLRLNPRWERPGSDIDPSLGEVRFLREEARPLLEELPDPDLTRTATRATPEQKASLWKKATDQVRQWDECLRNMPPEQARKNQFAYMMRDIGISEAWTAGGFIAASGGKEIKIKDLSADMFTTLISSGVSNFFVTQRNASVFMRWFRVTLTGEARAGYDAVYYYFTPIKDEHPGSERDYALNRLEYNATWNLATSGIPIALYTILGGMECMDPSRKTYLTTTALRIAAKGATSVGYFVLRNHVLNGQ